MIYGYQSIIICSQTFSVVGVLRGHFSHFSSSTNFSNVGLRRLREQEAVIRDVGFERRTIYLGLTEIYRNGDEGSSIRLPF